MKGSWPCEWRKDAEAFILARNLDLQLLITTMGSSYGSRILS